MRRTKLLAFLMCMIVCASQFAIPTFAANGICVNYFGVQPYASVSYERTEIPASQTMAFYYTSGTQNGWTILAGTTVQFNFKSEENEQNIYVGYIKDGVQSDSQKPDYVGRNIFQKLYRYKTTFTITEPGVYQFYIFNGTAWTFVALDCTIEF